MILPLVMGCGSLLSIDEFSRQEPTSTGAGGGPGGSTNDAGNGGGSPANYACQRDIVIQSDLAIEGYTILVHLEHAALVDADKSLASGDDVRVFERNDGGRLVEIDRVASPVTPWGSGQVEIAFRVHRLEPGDNIGYVVAYGSPYPTKPPADPARVFDIWDDFDGPALDPAWTAEPVGAHAGGTATVENGQLVVEAYGATVSDQYDSLYLVHRPIYRDFVAQCVVQWESGNSDESLLGGLMARADVNTGALFSLISFQKREQGQAWLGWRSSVGEAASVKAIPAQAQSLPVYFRMRRERNTFHGATSVDGVSFTEVEPAGISLSESLAEPCLVGLPFVNQSASEPSVVHVDWFRARGIVIPEPVVTLGPEQCEH